MANEMQLLLLPSDVTHEELCKKAQKIWVNYFGVARSSCMSRLDKGVKRTKPCLTVTNIQKQRRATSHQSDVDLNVDFQEVEGAAARGSSGIWSERMAKELTFQKNKQYDSRVEAYLTNALLEEEVDEEIKDAALKLQANRCKNDRERLNKEKRKENLLIPQKVDVERKKFHLENSSWIQEVNAAYRHNVMIHRWDADNWVVSDVSNPHETVLWTASLLGGLLADLTYFKAHGTAGLALHCQPFVEMSRRVYVSDAFKACHPRLGEALGHCLMHRRSKIKVMNTWEDFADVHSRTPTKSRMQIIAIASDEEATRANEANIMNKRNFASFMC